MNEPTKAASVETRARERGGRSVWRIVATRLAVAIPVLFLVLLLSFLLSDLVPSNPAATIAGENASPEVIAQVRQSLGLNQAVIPRFVSYLGHVVSTQKAAACCGGYRYKPMMSAAFFSKSGSSEAIQPSSRRGLRLCSRQTRAIIMCETPNCSASLRVLQNRVEPSSGLCFTVQSRIRASSAGVSVLVPDRHGG